MLQKLEDLWTYEYWAILKKENRPTFGPLRKIEGPSPAELVRQAVANRKRKEAEAKRKEDEAKRKAFSHSDGPSRDVASESPLNSDPTPGTSTSRSTCSTQFRSNKNIVDINNNVEDQQSTGWQNIQDFRERFEHEIQLPSYTGCCISNDEFDRHTSDTEEKYHTMAARAEVLPQYTSRMRSPMQQKPFQRPHTIKSPIEMEIDHDISEIAEQLRRGESALEIANKLATQNSAPIRTRNIRISDCEDVTVNVIENANSFLLHRSVTNTKTPCHTPSLPVPMQNTFNQIPFSTKALLQRSLIKLNFLSSKQKRDPDSQLSKTKYVSSINHANFWNPTIQPQAKSTQKQTVTNVNRKRKQPEVNVNIEPSPKRRNTGKTRTPKQSPRPVEADLEFDMFATPIYIPRQSPARL